MLKHAILKASTVEGRRHNASEPPIFEPKIHFVVPAARVRFEIRESLGHFLCDASNASLNFATVIHSDL
jgi:hypothetical protein